MYVNSNANDMFVMSNTAIISDFSTDCSSTGATRTFALEYPKHFNQTLAKLAIPAILTNDNVDVFWQFTNHNNLKKPIVTTMDVSKLFDTDNLANLKDFEFLTWSTIDEHADITGTTDVSLMGQRQLSKKLFIVQGFNLYEQISQNYYKNFQELDDKYKTALVTRIAAKDSVELRLILLFVVVITSFISVSVLQNTCVRGGVDVKNGGNTN